MKKIFFILVCLITQSARAQWKTTIIDDGFDKFKIFSSTKVHLNKGEGALLDYYTALVIQDNDLCLISDLGFNRRGMVYSRIILNVDGQEKEFQAISDGSQLNVNIFNDVYKISTEETYVIFFKNYLRDNDFFSQFIRAKKIKIKAEDNVGRKFYFESDLNPKETEKIWDANTGGKYFADKKLKEEELEKKRIEEQERIALEKQRDEEDSKTIKKINELLDGNLIYEAVKEYKKLNNTDDNIANVIKAKLNEFYEKEINIYALTNSEIEGYIQNNKINLKSVPAGIYTLTFDKKGVPDNASFPGLNTIPQKNLDPFKVKLKSIATIRIEIKDSILNSVKYFSGSKKQLFIDKSENFY